MRVVMKKMMPRMSFKIGTIGLVSLNFSYILNT